MKYILYQLPRGTASSSDGVNSYFQIPMGIAIATSISVGQFLGAAKKEAALCAARVGLTITGEFLL